MPLNLLPMSALGAVESNGAVTFGLWLPWVSAGDRNALTVKIIHEADQFLEGVPAREFALTHSVRAPYGDFWSATVPIAGTAPSASAPMKCTGMKLPPNCVISGRLMVVCSHWP